jgi:HlyD family secretion protein
MNRSMRSVGWLVALPLALLVTACGNEDGGEVEASGTIETTDVTVSPLVSGPVVRLLVDEGSVVRRGDTLALIDASDLELQRAQLLAGLDITRAQYELLRNGPRTEDIAQAVEAERQAKATLDNAADDLRRLEQSYSAGGIAEKTVTDARTRLEIARRTHETALLNVAKLRNGSRREDLRAGEAREAQAEAQLVALEKKIGDCVVRAPTDGVLTSVAIEQGEFAAAGGALMTISRTQDIELTIYVPEGDLGRVRLGQRADLSVDSYEGRTFPGRVTYISPVAEFTPKNVQTKDDRVKQVFAVKISAQNPDGALHAGLTADARLHEDSATASKSVASPAKQ